MTDEAPKARVACFVDGFNLYHAIDELRDKDGTASLNHIKWLNLRSLASAYAPPSKYEISQVYYCSAFATWRTAGYLRHRIYTEALEAVGVTVVLGRFADDWNECHTCRRKWNSHTEKETDVNLAVTVIREAHKGTFDHAMLITADSDQCPTVRYLKEAFPRITIQIVTPPYGFDKAHELRSLAPAVKIKRKHLHSNLLPENITLPSGKVISRPEKYTPPTKEIPE